MPSYVRSPAWIGDIVVGANGFTVANQTIRVDAGWNAAAVALVVGMLALVMSLVRLQDVPRRVAFVVFAATIAWLVNLGFVVFAIFAANLGATASAHGAVERIGSRLRVGDRARGCSCRPATLRTRTSATGPLPLRRGLRAGSRVYAVPVTPAANIELLRAGTRRLLSTVDGLTDDQAREASRLPGWNRAEVLTHLARNADGTRRMVQAAARGEVEAQYPGGVEARATDIAAGRDATATDVLRDVRCAHEAMMEAWQALPEDAWDRIGRTISGDRSMREALWSRVREVEVHHVDLAMGYEPTDWPVGFVAGALEEIFGSFERRGVEPSPADRRGVRCRVDRSRARVAGDVARHARRHRAGRGRRGRRRSPRMGL